MIVYLAFTIRLIITKQNSFRILSYQKLSTCYFMLSVRTLIQIRIITLSAKICLKILRRLYALIFIFAEIKWITRSIVWTRILAIIQWAMMNTQWNILLLKTLLKVTSVVVRAIKFNFSINFEIWHVFVVNIDYRIIFKVLKLSTVWLSLTDINQLRLVLLSKIL
jgi:hypothetical protein